jgi:oxygen-independent coproporphyrinogen-3 oxidase
VDRALAAIRAAGVPALNIDLMYGIAGQTARTWDASLRAALSWHPEEVYLYPLYVRPLTGLGRRGHGHDTDWDEQRMRLYRQGRDTLRAAGYRQLSMRHFHHDGVTRPPAPGPARAERAPRSTDYSCQDDGMVGLGCGARSYTRDLHYSFDYAVSVGGVRAVIADYLARPAGDFAYAEVGFALDEGERRRRWLVKTLLRSEGVDRAAWRARFGGDVTDAVPHLAHLAERGWLTEDAATVRLTDEGLAHSDAVGPWLVSDAVQAAMGEYELR